MVNLRTAGELSLTCHQKVDLSTNCLRRLAKRVQSHSLMNYLAIDDTLHTVQRTTRHSKAERSNPFEV